MTDRIEVQAPAKINLALDVTGVREDGYHEVRMIMQAIRLSDRVSLRKIARPETVLKTNLPFLGSRACGRKYGRCRSALRNE